MTLPGGGKLGVWFEPSPCLDFDQLPIKQPQNGGSRLTCNPVAIHAFNGPPLADSQYFSNAEPFLRGTAQAVAHGSI